MKRYQSELESLDTILLLTLIALTEHAVFPLRPVVAWATVLLYLVLIVVKLRAKASLYVQALIRLNKKERRRYAVSSSKSFQLNDCPLRSALPDSITRSDVDFIDRAAWVLRLTHHVFAERHKGSHNVLVINDKLEYHFDAQGILERFLITYRSQSRAGNVPYAVVVFSEGRLVNMGDGGDINWDWQGNSMRSGNKMLTFNPCVPGIAYKQGS